MAFLIILPPVDSLGVLIKHGPQDHLLRKGIAREREVNVWAGGTLSSQEIIVRLGCNHQFRGFHRGHSLPRRGRDCYPLASLRGRCNYGDAPNGQGMANTTPGQRRCDDSPGRSHPARACTTSAWQITKSHLKIHLPGVFPCPQNFLKQN